MTENPRDQGWGLWTEGRAAALPHKQRGTSHRASPGAVVLLGYRQGMGQPRGWPADVKGEVGECPFITCQSSNTGLGRLCPRDQPSKCQMFLAALGPE